MSKEPGKGWKIAEIENTLEALQRGVGGKLEAVTLASDACVLCNEEGRRVRAIRYQADFSYERPTAPDVTGEIHWLKVVEDVKSRATKTRVYEIKKKLLQEKFGIEIREV